MFVEPKVVGFWIPQKALQALSPQEARSSAPAEAASVFRFPGLNLLGLLLCQKGGILSNG